MKNSSIHEKKNPSTNSVGEIEIFTSNLGLTSSPHLRNSYPLAVRPQLAFESIGRYVHLDLAFLSFFNSNIDSVIRCVGERGGLDMHPWLLSIVLLLSLPGFISSKWKNK